MNYNLNTVPLGSLIQTVKQPGSKYEEQFFGHLVYRDVKREVYGIYYSAQMNKRITLIQYLKNLKYCEIYKDLNQLPDYGGNFRVYGLCSSPNRLLKVISIPFNNPNQKCSACSVSIPHIENLHCKFCDYLK